MICKRTLRSAILVGLCVVARGQTQDQPDLILHHGKIVTVDKASTIAQAIAIRGERIVKVGTDADVLATKGDKTRVVDLGGNTVLPGLIDSHTHPTGASMFEFDHDVPQMETVQDVLNYIALRAKVVPAGQWIWVNQVFITRLREQRYPTKTELDIAAPQHPVVFSTGPDAVASSLALKLSGIDKDFRVTGGGQIELDPGTGEPNGMLRGDTKRYLKGRAPSKSATDDDRADRLAMLLRDYNSVGITGIADRDASESGVQLFQRLKQEKRLTVRVGLSYGVNARQKLTEVKAAIAKVAEHPVRKNGDPWLKIIGIKSFLDGGMLTGSAYMRKPWGVSKIYSIRDPEYRGVLFIQPEDLQQIVQTTVDHGLQFTAHSVGDGAVHNLIDAYESVNQFKPVRDTRPCITHCNFMSAEAVERMAKLGIVCDIQPAWLYLDSHTLQAQFGYDRLRYFQPLKSLFAAGVITGGGSDHMQKIGSFRAINPYNPFLGMATAITRRGRSYEGQLHPEEALSREQAIRFYTINNAYLLFLEEHVGSLEAGKQADLIVIDRDLLTCAETDIRDTRVLQTYVAGKVVYEGSGDNK